MSNDLEQLRQEAYEARVNVEHLRREVYGRTDPSTAPDGLFNDLETAEQTYNEANQKLIDAEGVDPDEALILRAKKGSPGTLGAATTGLEAEVYLRMPYVPTAICHLFEAGQNELVSAVVKFRKKIGPNNFRRVRVISFVEGYSAKAVETAELKINQELEFKQMPTFYTEALNSVTELTRATLNVLIEDLDGEVELHATYPIWLLARTTAPLSYRDPKTGERNDLTHYLGAFVTPNAPELMKYLRVAADKSPSGRLIGYQGSANQVEPQVRAIFNALKEESEVTYVNSIIDFNPDQATFSQRVRLPRESLLDHEANCIDGTVLMASLLEGISLNPAIVLIPGHAFLGWETWKNSGRWRYLETTMIGTEDFKEARRAGEDLARKYQKQAKDRNDPKYFRRLSLKDLRVNKGITPMA